MSAADQLYGLYVIYNGLPQSSQISSKPVSYLESCAKSLIPLTAESVLDQGAKTGQLIPLSLKSFKFDEKFMKVVEKHLINLEEEVPEFKSFQTVKLEPKKKKKKKFRFTDSIHKKSIIVEHLKSSKSLAPLKPSQVSVPCYHIFKRKPRG